MHTLIVKDLLLSRALVVDAVKLKAKVFCVVFRIRYAHDGWTASLLAACGHCGDNGVFVQFKLQQRTDPCDDAHTHVSGGR